MMSLSQAITLPTQTILGFGELSLREVSICNLLMLVIMMALLERVKMQRLSLGSCTLTTSESFPFTTTLPFSGRDVQEYIVKGTGSESLCIACSHWAGKELRLKQQYFWTAAALSDIIRRWKKIGVPWSEFRELPCPRPHGSLLLASL